MVTATADVTYSQMRKETPELYEEIKIWLEWSGAKLLAMRISSPAPRGTRVAWPEYASSSEAYGYTPNTLRAGIPSRFDITLMEEVLLLPNLIPDIMTRRIVHCRALVAPVSGRYLYSWEKIGTLLHTNGRAVAYRHGKGLRTIAENLSPDKASTLRQSFARIAQ